MTHDPIRRQAANELSEDRMCPPPTRSGGDGRAPTAILVAQAIAGAIPAGWARDANGCGRRPSGRSACGGNSRHGSGIGHGYGRSGQSGNQIRPGRHIFRPSLEATT